MSDRLSNIGVSYITDLSTECLKRIHRYALHLMQTHLHAPYRVSCI